MLSDRVKEELKDLKNELRDLTLVPTLMMAFIDEKGLTEEFESWAEENEDEIRKFLP
jgi:hypothetical protein